MSGRGNPFRPTAVLGMVAAGAAAFLLLLYAIGAGWTGGEDNNGGAHASSNGLTGFSALAALLERRGTVVSLSRSPTGLAEPALVVINPAPFADADELARLIEDRAFRGPTLLILPKWSAYPLPTDPRLKAQDGWVALGGTQPPSWMAQVEPLAGIFVASGRTQGWEGLGLAGQLPDPAQVQGVAAEGEPPLLPLVTDVEGDILAARLATTGAEWPLTIVFEPDLMNNYGLADEARARLAVALVEEAMDGEELPVIFDLTLAGLGSSENLLTLAFRPPFLAATLALLLAALVIAWRGFRRFGPARAEAPAMAPGKAQLARNGAALLERAKRWHLLGPRYAALVGGRVAASLGLTDKTEEAREAAIDRAMAARDPALPAFSSRAEAMRTARRPAEIVRAAGALRTIERTISR